MKCGAGIFFLGTWEAGPWKVRGQGRSTSGFYFEKFPLLLHGLGQEGQEAGQGGHTDVVQVEAMVTLTREMAEKRGI